MLAYLAISGIPPFGIFFSEIKIFEGILFSDKPFVLLLVMVFMLFIFINMGKIVFTMLYKKGNEEISETISEKFDIIQFAAILLMILLVTIAVTSPEIIYHNILNVAKDFGVTL